MRKVYLHDVKKLSVQLVGGLFWKKWAAEHECEELKGGMWLEPVPAMDQQASQRNEEVGGRWRISAQEA